MMIVAMAMAMPTSQRGGASSPKRFRDAVNWISGTTAKVAAG